MTTPAIHLGTESLLAELVDAELENAQASHRLGAKALPMDYGHLSAALYQPLHAFLSQPGKEFRARMVEISWKLVDGPGQLPVELSHVVELLHAGSLIVDDIEDGSPTRRGRPALHTSHGLPVALNAANWLYFWTFSLLERADLGARTELLLYRAICRTLSRCHEGQALDLTLTMGRLGQAQVPRLVEATTRLKTGALMGLAATLPAIAAGAPQDQVEGFRCFGENVGVALQMLDDLSGLASHRHADKGHEDLRLGRPTWPWAWLAKQLSEMDYARLQQRAREVEAGDLHPEVLAKDLRAQLGPVARRRVTAHVDRLFDTLPEQAQQHPGALDLSRELQRLLASYD